jgi:hypothetical protein
MTASYAPSVPALLVRHSHSRFQLRRGTGATSIIGGVLIALGAVTLFGTLGSAPQHPAAAVCPSLFALALAFAGYRIMQSGALLLESMGSGAYVASIDRQVSAAELKGVEVEWRYDTQREKEVEVRLIFEGSSADVTQGFLPHPDPDELGKQLGAQLGVRVDVNQREPQL